MVFQHFALLPHLTVLGNVAFPLEIQGVDRAKREGRAREIIELVGLQGRETYYPRELSGGQQQRVGIARSLAVEPEIWFLDEPFSALDPLIRREMQDEFMRLQGVLRKTIVFITHDFDEAIRLADRIAIMKFGVLEQVGTPEDVYFCPATPFVRDFLGKTFLLPGKITAAAEQTISVEVQGSSTASLQLPLSKVIGAANGSLALGQGVTVAIRPEQVNLTAGRQDGRANMVEATLQTVQFLGDRYEYTVTLGTETRVITSPEPQHLKSGDLVYLELKPEGMTLWPTEK